MLDGFRLAVNETKPYYLCVGNCYITIIKSQHEKLLDRPAYYVNFQGASDKGLYCYSLLDNCQGVFFFSAWANIASVATTKHFTKWRKILDELLMIGCPVVMIEAPICQKNYRHPKTKETISIEQLKVNRAEYTRDVVGTIKQPNLIYRDMADVVGYDSSYLVDKYPTRAPWHLSSLAVKKMTKYFTRVMISGEDAAGQFLSH